MHDSAKEKIFFDLEYHVSENFVLNVGPPSQTLKQHWLNIRALYDAVEGNVIAEGHFNY